MYKKEVCLMKSYLTRVFAMAPAPISETCNVPSCRVFILFDPRADPMPVVLWTSADRSEQPAHNSGPTTKPAPMRPVLATKSSATEDVAVRCAQRRPVHA